MPRSYREEQIHWGITTALQFLLMSGKSTYSVEDIMNIARMFDVEDNLIARLSYVPNDLEDGGYNHFA